jgi:glycosyltransferase involved in cell wall biosynthesis
MPASVLIVSRGRPQPLMRTLTGISQVQYWNFEVVVVADPDGIAAAEGLPFVSDLKLVTFDESNISAARNLGLTQIAGEIIAFIDDDGVPEPMWLPHLVAPAARPEVAAMGGCEGAKRHILSVASRQSVWAWQRSSFDGEPQASQGDDTAPQPRNQN